MFPAKSFVQQCTNLYDSIKSKSIELVHTLSNTKPKNTIYYIYLVYRTPDRIMTTDKRVNDIECVINKSNEIRAKYVELISDTDTTNWNILPYYM